MFRDVSQNKQAFTLIELLVVIAIIGILAAATSAVIFKIARDSAYDSNIKQSLSHLRNVAAELFYSASPNSYASVCFDAPLDLILKEAERGGTDDVDYQCLATTDAWVAIFPLRRGNYWCADGRGASREVLGFVPYTYTGYVNCVSALGSDPEPDAPPEGSDPGNTAPILSLAGNLEIEIWSPSGNPFSGGAWHKYQEPGYTAVDNEDGNIKGGVITVGPTLIAEGGPSNCKEYTYTLVYSVTDSGGLSDGPDTRTIVHHKCNAP